ncbi:MAG: hypothetical protein AAF657_14045 [Acidobacteriota bacterium]
MSKARLRDTRRTKKLDRIAEIAASLEPPQSPPIEAPQETAPPPGPGPRGGKTTTTAGGLLRKTCYFEPTTWEAIEARARADKITAAEVVRRAVGAYL